MICVHVPDVSTVMSVIRAWKMYGFTTCTVYSISFVKCHLDGFWCAFEWGNSCLPPIKLHMHSTPPSCCFSWHFLHTWGVQSRASILTMHFKFFLWTHARIIWFWGEHVVGFNPRVNLPLSDPCLHFQCYTGHFTKWKRQLILSFRDLHSIYGWICFHLFRLHCPEVWPLERFIRLAISSIPYFICLSKSDLTLSDIVALRNFGNLALNRMWVSALAFCLCLHVSL